MARPPPNRRYRYRRCGVLPWTRAQGSPVRQKCPRPVRNDSDAAAGRAGRVWGLSEVTSGQGNPREDPSGGRASARSGGKGHAGGKLGANAVWRDHGTGVLSRRPYGTVFGAFHHGQCVYRVRDPYDGLAARGTVLAASHRPQSGVL